MPFQAEPRESFDAPPILADQAPLKSPGIYLIALRAHLNRGKSIIGDLVESVTDAMPEPREIFGGSKQAS